MRILVADDLEDNRILVRVFLSILPYELEFAVDGEEALAKILRTRYDLALVDVHMPKKNGYEVMESVRGEEARRGAPRMPIIAVTAEGPEEAKRSYDAGADLHLSKPLSREELLAGIERLTGAAVVSR